jgi:hypothetical protein
VGTLILVVVAVLAVGAIALGLRHVYLKVSRPGGFECSLRVTSGEVPGLTPRFRAGYAGREVDDFVWRRMAWPSPPVRFPAAAVRLDEERAPSVRDRMISVPSTFAVVPVVLGDDVRLDLALARGKRKRIIAALGS